MTNKKKRTAKVLVSLALAGLLAGAGTVQAAQTGLTSSSDFASYSAYIDDYTKQYTTTYNWMNNGSELTMEIDGTTYQYSVDYDENGAPKTYADGDSYTLVPKDWYSFEQWTRHAAENIIDNIKKEYPALNESKTAEEWAVYKQQIVDYLRGDITEYSDSSVYAGVGDSKTELSGTMKFVVARRATLKAAAEFASDGDVLTALGRMNTVFADDTVTVNGVTLTDGNVTAHSADFKNVNASTASIENLGVSNYLYAEQGTIGGVGLGGGNIYAETGTIGGVGMQNGNVAAMSAIFGEPDTSGSYANGYVAISSNGYIDAASGSIGNVGFANGYVSNVSDAVNDDQAVNLGQLKTQVEEVRTEVAKITGGAQYTSENYVGNGDTLTAAVSKLDAQVKTNADGIGDLQYSSTEYVTKGENLTVSVGKLDEAVGKLAESSSTNTQDVSDLKKKVGDTKYTSTNYIKSESSLTEAASALDAQAKTNAEGIAANKDAIGDLQYASANYVTKGDSLTSAVSSLDAQVKTNAAGIAANKSSIETINTKLGDGTFINGEETYTDAINVNTALIAQNGGVVNELSYSVAKLGGEIDSVGAISAALAGMHPLDYDGSQSKWQMSAALGSYDGSSALAMGGFYHVNEDVMLSGGVSTILKGERKTAMNMGVTFRVGQSGTKTAAVPADALKEAKAEIAQLKEDRARQDEKIAEQDKKLAEQDAALEELKERFEELLAKVR